MFSALELTLILLVAAVLGVVAFRMLHLPPMLGYLAVAHHGRGRGDWQPTEPPAAWGDAVDAALVDRRSAVQSLWQQRAGWLADAPAAAELGRWQTALAALLTEACADVLGRLYPGASRVSGL